TYTALCALSTKSIAEGEEDGEQPEHETDDKPTPSRRSVSRLPLVAPPRKRQLESDDLTPSKAKKKKNTSEPSSSRDSAASRQKADAGDDELSFANVITSTNPAGRRETNEEEEPLFYPMSQASQSLRDAGWGDVEHLSQAQLAEMLDDDIDIQGDGDTTMRDAEEEDREGVRMGGTQDFIPPTQNQQSSSFQPLFYD
ncbi:217_t:CDS:1, partial [Acaulospora colombiana]